jgi:hypothetical protein
MLMILGGAAGWGAQETVHVHIRSTYFGHSGTETAFDISCHGERCSSAGKPVPWTDVERLLQAAERPAIPKVTAAGLGLTSEWLKENAADAWKELPLGDDPATPGQKAFFASAFVDSQRVQKALEKLYRSPMPLHDLPGVQIEIRRAGGSKVEVRSTSSFLYLMPWEVTREGKKVETWDRAVSDAVGRLMPEEFLNRDRLLDPVARDELALALWYTVIGEWSKAGAEDRIGPSLAVLRQRFDIQESMVVTLEEGDRKVTTWEGKLHASDLADLPHGTTFQVSLPVEGDHLVAPRETMDRLDRVAALPLSIPWFRAALDRHPGAKVTLYFDQDRSLSPHERELFTDDMNEGNEEQDALGDEVERLAAAVTRLDVSEGKDQWSRWIALPDRRMILWSYKGDQVLDWKLAKCPRPCVAGWVVHENGELVHSSE